MDHNRGRTVSSADSAFAEAVRHARQEAGVSQEDLAAEMTLRGYDFHQQTVYKIETNKRKITIGEAVALAEILEVPLGVLAERNPESIQSRRARIELDAKRLLEKLVDLGNTIGEARNETERLRNMVDEIEKLDPDARDWPGGRSAKDFFYELFNFHELDGLQWSWGQLRLSYGGQALFRYFKVLPPSELPIPNYDDEDEEIDG